MKNTVDILPWTIFEVTVGLLFLRIIFKRKELNLTTKDFSIPLLLLILLVALSLSWSKHFHATLMSIYKLIFIAMALPLFMKDIELWEDSLRKSILIITAAGTVTALLFPKALEIIKTPHGSLFFGFLALGGILSMGLFLERKKSYYYAILTFLTGCALLYHKTLSPFLGWASGILWLSIRNAKRKSWRILLPLLLFIAISFVNWPRGMNPLHNLWERKSEDPYTLERLKIWKDSFRIFLDYPLMGTSLGTFRDHYPQYKTIDGVRNAPYAHNIILQILCEIGLLGFLLFLWLGIKWLSISPKEGTWSGITLAILVQSLFDFNLHYPPILVLFIFSISLSLPIRTIRIENKIVERTTISFIILLIILFLLPGIADLLFKMNYKDPSSRAESALTASKLDPFNALYRIEIGNRRNLFYAIDLEPRNVWFRRTCAQIYFEEWKKYKRPADLQIVLDQHQQILRLAPNVEQFRNEVQEIQSSLDKN